MILSTAQIKGRFPEVAEVLFELGFSFPIRQNMIDLALLVVSCFCMISGKHSKLICGVNRSMLCFPRARFMNGCCRSGTLLRAARCGFSAEFDFGA